MKKQVSSILAVVIFLNIVSIAQAQEVQTIFKHGAKSSGGYGGAINKFTTIRGDFANIAGVYGGWYVNHRLLIGLEVAGATNNIHVPSQYSIDPLRRMSYEYGQGGLRLDYVLNSAKPVHLAFNLFSGAGFIVQYDRFNHGYGDVENGRANWFFVAEPGVQLEMNLFKWMRFSPGVSYRAAFGSDAAGLNDKSLSNLSYNATLKFGKF